MVVIGPNPSLRLVLVQSVPKTARINQRRLACVHACLLPRAARVIAGRGGDNPANKYDSSAEVLLSSRGERQGEGAPIKPSASDAKRRLSVPNGCCHHHWRQRRHRWRWRWLRRYATHIFHFYMHTLFWVHLV